MHQVHHPKLYKCLYKCLNPVNRQVTTPKRSHKAPDYRSVWLVVECQIH